MTGNAIRPLVAAALLALAAPAIAEPEYSATRVTIDASGIDLTSATGREALDRRVQNAIKAICGAPIYGTREEADELRACRAETRAAVQSQVQAMLLRANVTVSENR